MRNERLQSKRVGSHSPPADRQARVSGAGRANLRRRRISEGVEIQRARASVPFVLAERCVPLARNEMCPSGVMFASQVMCASRVRSGTRHTTLRQRRNTSLWRSHNITAATPQLHFFFPTAPKLWTDSNRHTPSKSFQKTFPFKNYLQSHRCNGILDGFGLAKAFLWEEGGTRSVTEGACVPLSLA